jgi:hypothetical protein
MVEGMFVTESYWAEVEYKSIRHCRGCIQPLFRKHIQENWKSDDIQKYKKILMNMTDFG